MENKPSPISALPLQNLAEPSGVLLLDATRQGYIEGILLRFGGFYGPRAGAEITTRLLHRRWLPLVKNSDNFVIPLIHIEDAAAAVVAAPAPWMRG